jgi:hypothetical protein
MRPIASMLPCPVMGRGVTRSKQLHRRAMKGESMYRAQHAKRSGGKKFGALVAMIGLAGALVLSLAVPAAIAKDRRNQGR